MRFFASIAIIFTFLGISCQCIAAPQSHLGCSPARGAVSEEDRNLAFTLPISLTPSTDRDSWRSKSSEALGSHPPLAPQLFSMVLVASPVVMPVPGQPISSPPTSLRANVLLADNKPRGQWRRALEATAGQSPVAIAFEILGGLVGMVVLILCGRSIRNYCRTPRRDLVAEHIDRFNLERELAEIEEGRLRERERLRRTLFPLSPPAYEEAPKYEPQQVAKHDLTSQRCDNTPSASCLSSPGGKHINNAARS